MKYLKTYESLYDAIKPYINKYIVYKKEKDNYYYLLKIKEEMRVYRDLNLNKMIITDKLYTLKPDETIKKNKKHSNYTFGIGELNNIMYYSDNLIDAYKVLNSIYDTKKI